MARDGNHALNQLLRRQHGVISRAQALELGFTDSAISRLLSKHAWTRIYPAVFRVGVVNDYWRSSLMGAVLWARGKAWASHRAAAALWGLDAVNERIIEISATANLRHAAVRVHRTAEMPSCDTRVRDAIMVTDPTRTLIDLGSVVGPSVLESCALDALRRGMTTVAKLKRRSTSLQRRGRAGVAQLKSLIEDWERSGAPTTKLESLLYRMLKRYRLTPFVTQLTITDGGAFVARVDAAYPTEKVVVEADSYRWHSSTEQWKRDLARRNKLTALGWHVLHFTWEDLRHRDSEVAAQIRAALKH